MILKTGLSEFGPPTSICKWINEVVSEPLYHETVQSVWNLNYVMIIKIAASSQSRQLAQERTRESENKGKK